MSGLFGGLLAMGRSAGGALAEGAGQLASIPLNMTRIYAGGLSDAAHQLAALPQMRAQAAAQAQAAADLTARRDQEFDKSLTAAGLSGLDLEAAKADPRSFAQAHNSQGQRVTLNPGALSVAGRQVLAGAPVVESYSDRPGVFDPTDQAFSFGAARSPSFQEETARAAQQDQAQAAQDRAALAVQEHLRRAQADQASQAEAQARLALQRQDYLRKLQAADPAAGAPRLPGRQPGGARTYNPRTGAFE